MKKVTTLLLILTLAMLPAASVTATAEELPYIRQLPQYEFIMETLLTPESYPEVRLMPYYPFSLFGSSPAEPLFLCFPGPEGASATEFSSMSANYLDLENLISYTYDERESDSFEEFINKASDDQYILLDGSDDTAAYIDPDGECAYGLIATREFGKSSKLWFRVALYKLDSKMPLETRVDSLTTAVLDEMTRITSQMHYETYEPYWSYGQFAGVKILDYDYQTLCSLDFPSSVLYYSDGSTKEVPFFITSLEGVRMEGIYDFGDGAYVEVEAEYEDYSYPASKLEEGDPDATTVTLDNGSEWLFYASNYTDGERINFWYASKAIEGVFDGDRQVYLSLHFDGNRIEWADINDCMLDVIKWESGLKIVSPEEDPYVEPETPATEAAVPEVAVPEEAAPEEAAQETAAEAGSWICESCGTENTGNFCTECGTAKPAESAEWTCPSCGTENAGKFCSNCGTAKP